MTQLDRLEALAKKGWPRRIAVNNPWPSHLLDADKRTITRIEDRPSLEVVVAAVNALPDLIRIARAAKAASDKWINEPTGYAPPMSALAKALAPLFTEVES